MSLNGRTAVVTGGAGALGSVVVRHLALEGARVVIATQGRTPGGLFTAKIGKRVRFAKADVTSERSVGSLFRGIGRREGRADILINCAGGFVSTGPFAKSKVRDWDRMLALNLRSVFLCCREFLRQAVPGGYGRIINISAQTAFRISTGRSAYAVAKGGVATLTELLGEELRGSGITVNAFAPSILRTRDNIASMPGADQSAWVDPEDLAAEIVHLCERSASPISGAVIPIFGGVKA